MGSSEGHVSGGSYHGVQRAGSRAISWVPSSGGFCNLVGKEVHCMEENVADIKGRRGGRVSITIKGTFSNAQAHVLAMLIERCATRGHRDGKRSTKTAGGPGGESKARERQTKNPRSAKGRTDAQP